jgi:hypothetical protein
MKKRKLAEVEVKLEPRAGAAGAGLGSARSSVPSSRAKAGASAGSESEASIEPPPAKRRRRCVRDKDKATVKVEVKKEKGKGKGKGKGGAGQEEGIDDDGGEEEEMFDLAPRKGGKRGEELLGPPRKRGSGKWDGVSRWLHFSRCRAFARSLKLKSLKEWQAWCKVPGQRPVDVPSCPNVVYAGVLGWKGYGDFLGNDFKFKPFDEARAFARGLKLSGVKEWRAWKKKHRPSDIPSGPDQTYKEAGWTNWGDFLGTGNQHCGSFKPFDEARAFVRGLKLSCLKEWRAWSKKHRPSDIPSAPDQVYKEAGWKNWGDFLGTGNQKYGSFKPFGEARALARGLKLSGWKEWHAWSKKHRPSDIPSSPDRTYKEAGWTNWGDFLGTGNKRYGSFKPFDEARAFARGLKLSSLKEWRAWRKKHRPSDIPGRPEKTYKEAGWINWGDFLGTGNKRNGYKYT